MLPLHTPSLRWPALRISLTAVHFLNIQPRLIQQINKEVPVPIHSLSSQGFILFFFPSEHALPYLISSAGSRKSHWHPVQGYVRHSAYGLRQLRWLRLIHSLVWQSESYVYNHKHSIFWKKNMLMRQRASTFFFFGARHEEENKSRTAV